MCFQPSPQRDQTDNSLESALSSFAMICLISFGNESGEAPCFTICSSPSAAISSQYASQKDVIRTIADLLRTSRPRRRPCEVPPFSSWSFRSRSISSAFSSNSFRALLGIFCSIGLTLTIKIVSGILLCSTPDSILIELQNLEWI